MCCEPPCSLGSSDIVSDEPEWYVSAALWWGMAHHGCDVSIAVAVVCKSVGHGTDVWYSCVTK